ncbi:DedA family protein [Bacillus piscicola]|uniref:DedA family protein n=1 Tax=Bacillus piscicola TaxID=1632684 RepID=UPI001F099EEB|nr:hypothetical protein [Bacillus piscicola]
MLPFILDILKNVGVVGLFLGISIEAMSLPFPAAIVILVYGYILDPGGWGFVILSVGAAACYTAVAFIPYGLALRYDHLLQNRMSKAGAKQMITFMKKYKEWTITAGRILGMGYIVYVAAFYRITPLTYGFFTFIGILPIALLMFYLGSIGNIEAVYTWFQNIQYAISALIVILIVSYLFYRWKRKKHYQTSSRADK